MSEETNDQVAAPGKAPDNDATLIQREPEVQRQETPSQGAQAPGGTWQHPVRKQVHKNLRALSYKSAGGYLSPTSDHALSLAQNTFAGPSVAVDPGSASAVHAATGIDVSGARLHQDAGAKNAASQMGAQAFAVGNHVGGDLSNKSVLFHELGHVAQQKDMPGGEIAALNKPEIGPSPDKEAQADQTAATAMTIDTVAKAAPETKKKPENELITQLDEQLKALVPQWWAEAAREILGNKKSKKLAKERQDSKDIELEQAQGTIPKSDPLAYFVALNQEAEAVRRDVMAVLDGGEDLFSQLLDRAGYENLWKSVDVAQAIVDLMKLRSIEDCLEDIDQLLSWKPFDWGINRYEARLAWELLEALPEAEQQKVLAGTPIEVADPSKGKTKTIKTKEVSEHLQDAQKNLSQEYKESTRYDTYSGEKKPEGEDAGEMSDKDSLLTQATDPDLWTDPKQDTKLRGILMMVVQADQTEVVKDEVAANWKAHQAMLTELGFKEDGTWGKVVEDKTASTGLSRTWSWIKGAWDILCTVVGGLAGTKSSHTLEIGKALEEAFIRNNIGLDINNLKTDEERRGLLKLLIGDGSDAAVQAVQDKTGWDLPLLIKKLQLGAGGVGVDALESMKSRTKDQKEDASKSPTAKLSQDDDAGITKLEIPLLPANGQTQIMGDMTLKLGASALVGVRIEIKSATKDDPTRYIEMAIDRAVITDMMVIQPESMMVLQKASLDNLLLRAVLEKEVKPQSVLGSLLGDIGRALFKVLQLIPAIGDIAKIGDLIEDGVEMGDIANGMTGTAVTEMQFMFDSVTVSGLTTSGGMNLDEVTVGATDITIDPGALVSGWTDRSALEKEMKRLEKVKGRIERRVKDEAKAAQQMADIQGHMARVQKLLDLNEKLTPIQAESDALAEQIANLKREAGPKPDAAQQAAIDELDKRKQKLDSDIETAEASTVEVKGVLGEVKAAGIDVAGTKVGSASMTATTFSKAKEGVGINASTAEIKVLDIEMVEDGRRDHVLQSRMAEIRKLAADAKRDLTQDEKDEINNAEEELRLLEPQINEYEALRERLDDPANPLDAQDKTRYHELHDILHPTAIKVGGASMTDVGGDVTLLDKNMNDMVGGMDVGNTTITDVQMLDTRTHKTGDQKENSVIDKVEGKGLDLGFLKQGEETRADLEIDEVTMSGMKGLGGADMGSLSLKSGRIRYEGGPGSDVASITAQSIVVNALKYDVYNIGQIEIVNGVIDYASKQGDMSVALKGDMIRMSGFSYGNYTLEELEVSAGLVGFTGSTANGLLHVKAQSLCLTRFLIPDADMAISGTMNEVDVDIGMLEDTDAKTGKTISTYSIGAHKPTEEEQAEQGEGKQRAERNAPMAKDIQLSLSGIEHPEDQVMSVNLSSLGGQFRMIGDNRYEIEGLNIGKITITGLDWEAGKFGLHADEPVELTDVRLDSIIEFEQKPGDKPGDPPKTEMTENSKIKAASIQSFKTAGLVLRFTDYYVDLGSTVIGKEGEPGGSLVQAAGLELTDYSFFDNTWTALSINDLQGKDMSLKLGKEVTARAQSISGGNITIAAMVTDQARKRRHKEGKIAYANRYSIKTNDVSGSKLEIQSKAKDSGLNLSITSINDLDIGEFSVDNETGDMAFRDVSLDDITLASMNWNATEVDKKTGNLSTSGVKLQNAKLSIIRASGSVKGDTTRVDVLDIALVEGDQIVYSGNETAAEPKAGEQMSSGSVTTLNKVVLKNLKVRGLKIEKGELVGLDLSADAASGKVGSISGSKVFGNTLSNYLEAGSTFNAKGIEYDVVTDKEGNTTSTAGLDRLSLTNIALKMKMDDGARLEAGLPGVTAEGVKYKESESEGAGKKKTDTALDITKVTLDKAATCTYFMPPAGVAGEKEEEGGLDDGWVDKFVLALLDKLNGTISITLAVTPEALAGAGLIPESMVGAAKAVIGDIDVPIAMTIVNGRPTGALGKLLSLIIAGYKAAPGLEQAASKGVDVLKSTGGTILSGLNVLISPTDPEAWAKYVNSKVELDQEYQKFKKDAGEVVNTAVTSYKEKPLGQYYEEFVTKAEEDETPSGASGIATMLDYVSWLASANINLFTNQQVKITAGTAGGQLSHTVSVDSMSLKAYNLKSSGKSRATIESSVSMKGALFGVTEVSQSGEGQKTETSVYGFGELTANGLKAMFQAGSAGKGDSITGTLPNGLTVKNLHYSNSVMVNSGVQAKASPGVAGPKVPR